jgi:hypothetical protein
VPLSIRKELDLADFDLVAMKKFVLLILVIRSYV